MFFFLFNDKFLGKRRLSLTSSKWRKIHSDPAGSSLLCGH